jgi:type IV secretion system protein VirB11
MTDFTFRSRAPRVQQEKTRMTSVYARNLEALADALSSIAQFLADKSVVEVMINPDGSVWVERLPSAKRRVDVSFAPGAVDRLARSIAAVEGTELNERRPTLACKVPGAGNGARAQILVPPIVAAPTVILRKHKSQVLPLSHWVEQGILKPHHARALEWAVHQRLNILVGGGTGSGKTTFVNTLLSLLRESLDRVVTIEDTEELRCEVPDRVAVRVIKDLYSWRDAVIDSMRMRPDRIIVGEVRDGASALELLTALNTGHPGSVATIHADSATQMLDRFCRLIEQVVPHAPRAEVAAAIHVCVHMQRDDSVAAGRVITEVLRVRGFDGSWITEDMEVG